MSGKHTWHAGTLIDLKFVEKPKILSEIVNCTFSPNNRPVTQVSAGEKVQLETYDCYANVVKRHRDLTKALKSGLKLFDNPLTGPVFVENAEPGDTLAVDIIDIKVPDIGLTTINPDYGTLGGWLTESQAVSKFTEIKHGKVHYETDRGKEISFPIKPFIGTIGVAPQTESIASSTPHKHGGNMDVSDVCAGNRLYLPVGVRGALFAVGDVHATQGDGEICGTAVEVPAIITVKFDVLKHVTIEWPRIESAQELMTVGSARPLEDAARLAFRELILWLEKDYGLSTDDAYMLLSLAARARIAQLVNPLYTVVAKLSRQYLPRD